MTNIAVLEPSSTFSNILFVDNFHTDVGLGLPPVVGSQIQDGQGNFSTMVMSQTYTNFNRDGGNEFRIGDVALTANIDILNALGGSAILLPNLGGTGVNNFLNTITVGVDFAVAGNGSLTLNTTNTTNVTLPTSGNIPNTSSGTFTPFLVFSDSAEGLVYTAFGTYTVISNIVFVAVEITLSEIGEATGNATITGFPFPASNVNCVGAITIMENFANITVPYVSIVNGTTALLYQTTDTSTIPLTNSNIGDGAYIALNLSYFTA